MSHAAFKGNLRNELNDLAKTDIITDGPKSRRPRKNVFAGRIIGRHLRILRHHHHGGRCRPAGLRPDRDLSWHRRCRRRKFRIAHIGIHFHMPKSLDESHQRHRSLNAMTCASSAATSIPTSKS